MKQKIKGAFLVVLTLALISAAAVAITWAFNAPESTMGTKVNTFTSGSITTALTERAWNNTKADDDTGTDYATADLGETKALNYVAGQAIPKNPKMTNTSTNDIGQYVAIRACYIVKDGDNYYFYTKSEFEGAIATLYHDTNTPVTPNDGSDDTAGIDSDWVIGSSNMFYYKNILYKDTSDGRRHSSSRLFDSVKIKDSFTKDGTNYSIPYYHAAVTSVDTNDPLAKDNSGGTALSGQSFTSSKLPEFHIVLYGYAVSSDGYDAYTNAKSAIDKLAGLSS